MKNIGTDKMIRTIVNQLMIVLVAYLPFPGNLPERFRTSTFC